jgi:hypothetical protein
MKPTHSPEQLLALLQATIREAPPLVYNEQRSEAELRWLGRAEAILASYPEMGRASVAFRIARSALNTLVHDRSNLLQPLYDALSMLELQVPAALQGAFIPAGDAWNGYAALVKLVQSPCDRLLIVDPYITADIFADFVPHTIARSGTRLLTAKNRERHPALLASSQKWQQTHPAPSAPVELRYAPESSLHDRLIVLDSSEVWLVSQSFKDIARKSSASVSRADPEMARMKAQHYESLWEASTAIG